MMKRLLPSRQLVCEHPRLRWATAWLDRPELWSLDRRRVAAGLAAGVFWGLLLPFGQFLAAGACAFYTRCNLPAALLGTFVSNPFTIVPTYAGAYWVGAVALGTRPEAALALMDWDSFSIREWLAALTGAGAPLALGLALLATFASLAIYGATMLAWRVAVARSRMRRRSSKDYRRGDSAT